MVVEEEEADTEEEEVVVDMVIQVNKQPKKVV